MEQPTQFFLLRRKRSAERLRQGREEAPEKLVLGIKVPRVEPNGCDLPVLLESLLHHEQGRRLAVTPRAIDREHETARVSPGGERFRDPLREGPAVETILFFRPDRLVGRISFRSCRLSGCRLRLSSVDSLWIR